MIKIVSYPSMEQNENEQPKLMNKRDYMVNYYKNNTQKIKERNLNYYYNHKDTRMPAMRAYYHENKNKLQEYKNQKITCLCGVIYTRCNSARHLSSKKHLEYCNCINEN